MILLLSQPFDHSTNKVIDWLGYFDAEYVRIPLHPTKSLSFCSASIGERSSDVLFRDADMEIALSDISSVWFRGGDLINMEEASMKEFGETDIGKASAEFLTWEWTSMNSWFNGLPMTKRHLGNPFLYETNKLMVLEKAKAVGLSVPVTRIFSKREDISAFFEECNGNMISKAIYNSFNFKRDNELYAHPTLKVALDNINRLPDKIGPSLFQQEIEKKIDLRICVVGDQVFCGAIFSQSNPKTRTDFRVYDHARPNRIVPFNLPDIIAKKIFGLMKSLNLNFGLIDMVLSTDDEYYFLEVNPIGQFDSLSVGCNFPIERTIAEYLVG